MMEVKIHLIAVKTGPGEWVITTTEMQHKYVASPAPEYCDCVICRLRVDTVEKALRDFYDIEK